MDSIVSEIIQQYQIRAEFGEKKYGVTLDREDLSTQDWIEHAKQEAMDLTLYLERLKKALNAQGGYHNPSGKVEASHETKDRIIYNLNKVILSQEDEIKAMNDEFKRSGLDFQGVFNMQADERDKLILKVDSQCDTIGILNKEKYYLEHELDDLKKQNFLLKIELEELKKEDHTKKKRGWHF